MPSLPGWMLPSRIDLELMKRQRAAKGKGGTVEPCPSPFVGNSMLRIACVISAMFHCCSCLSCVSIFISLHAYWNFIISSYKCNKMLIYMYNVHVWVCAVCVCVC